MILAIESAILGGSLCLAEGDNIIGTWRGPGCVSRAEDLLLNIDALTTAATDCGAQIKKIIVSNGPGSYTGIRIGIATALGLARAIGAECVGASVLECLLRCASGSGPVVTAVPFGKADIAWQRFEGADSYALSKGPSVTTAETFINSLDPHSATFVVTHQMYDTLAKAYPGARIINAGENIAAILVMAADAFSSSPRPLYVQRPRLAAP